MARIDEKRKNNVWDGNKNETSRDAKVNALAHTSRGRVTIRCWLISTMEMRLTQRALPTGDVGTCRQRVFRGFITRALNSSPSHRTHTQRNTIGNPSFTLIGFPACRPRNSKPFSLYIFFSSPCQPMRLLCTFSHHFLPLYALLFSRFLSFSFSLFPFVLLISLIFCLRF